MTFVQGLVYCSQLIMLFISLHYYIFTGCLGTVWWRGWWFAVLWKQWSCNGGDPFGYSSISSLLSWWYSLPFPFYVAKKLRFYFILWCGSWLFCSIVAYRANLDNWVFVVLLFSFVMLRCCFFLFVLSFTLHKCTLFR